MNYRELTRKLKRLGVEFRRQGRGSHEIWWHPSRGLYTTIPNHGARDMREGTLSRILRDLGLTREEVDRA